MKKIILGAIVIVVLAALAGSGYYYFSHRLKYATKDQVEACKMRIQIAVMHPSTLKIDESSMKERRAGSVTALSYEFKAANAFGTSFNNVGTCYFQYDGSSPVDFDMREVYSEK